MRAAVAAAIFGLVAAAALALPSSSRGAAPGEVLREVDFGQRLGARLPLDTTFRDAAGASVRLDELFGERPVFVVLAYYRCPNLCGTMLRTVARSLAPLTLSAGRDFGVIVIGIDPGEGPDAAAEARAEMLQAYARPGSDDGFHALTGSAEAIRTVADAIGFRYVYDDDLGQYIHPAGLTLATRDGRVARYFYGLEYLGRDLRLGLVEASDGRIGGPVDRVLLFCYGYDPSTGRYTLLITNVLRAAGAGAVIVLASFVGFQLRRERRRTAPAPARRGGHAR